MYLAAALKPLGYKFPFLQNQLKNKHFTHLEPDSFIVILYFDSLFLILSFLKNQSQKWKTPLIISSL
ncbi:hypothetical protein NC99_19480 [Sunxiuqinia dokdonensis]|uniref:Uncharacterized protein n=1 Tax=Sunxiuqinia dokdonensis TaxID=1409788 RepID=A0A0L8V9X4_9BACT|nr:hypothetical protein NC99_19480 [Sunxiuqinia dokdonensis]